MQEPLTVVTPFGEVNRMALEILKHDHFPSVLRHYIHTLEKMPAIDPRLIDQCLLLYEVLCTLVRGEPYLRNTFEPVLDLARAIKASVPPASLEGQWATVFDPIEQLDPTT